MTSPQWFLLIGALLLVRGLTATLLQRLPVAAAIIYLGVGVLFGPTALNLFHFNPLKESALLQVLTEVAVLISLFSAGVKMPGSFNFTRWRPPMLLATVSMALTVALVAAFAVYVLDLPLGAGFLLGAILAPTDPVLATDVQIRHPGDRDQLRFTLTCEAGMNDGSAFPFVMLGLGLLGLHELGDGGQRWLVVEVLWATIGAIAIGIAAGVALAKLGWLLRSKPHSHELMDDFLGLGLIGVVYGLCVLIDAWGFLAVFVAAVGLSLFLFVVARPLSVLVGLLGSGTPWRIRGLTAWFGVRGMGSLYYLMFAIQHGLPEGLALQLIQLSLIVVTMSILLHGTSVKPLLAVFWRRGN
jgi:NhaP-type Na+/H+ or K+/H+ antiporter